MKKVSMNDFPSFMQTFTTLRCSVTELIPRLRFRPTQKI
jgi:hypothetical protein